MQELEKDGKKVSRFSVTGYSLGGLVARYVVGVLHQRNFFKNVAPVNFNTIATPHIGLPRYPSLISSLASSLGPKLLSRTGEQFYCADQWSPSGRPLIEVMADPGEQRGPLLSPLSLILSQREYSTKLWHHLNISGFMPMRMLHCLILYFISINIGILVSTIRPYHTLQPQ